MSDLSPLIQDAVKGLKIVDNAWIEGHSSLDSSSSRLAEMADQGAPHGSLVVAETQVKGRGRRGRSFSSPIGGLYFSLLLREQASNETVPVSLMTGLAASQAIDEVGRVATSLKWPNDIQLNGKKIGGILTEATRDAHGPRVIVGVGLNINTELRSFPFLLRSSVSSVMLQTQREHDPLQILRACLSWIESHLLTRDKGKGDLIIGQVSDRMPIVGQEVQVRIGRSKVVGRVLALNATGSLILNTDSGRQVINAGEVEQLRPR